MTDGESMQSPVEATPVPETSVQVRSLRELIDLVSGKDLLPIQDKGDAGLSETIPFPFLAMVGQEEMKLALLLTLINPAIGGVLLIGPRGTGKTTAVRSLVDLLPEVPRSSCYYGCMPDEVESGGIDAICPDCARKYAEGIPLNARLEDVIGGLDERASLHERVRLRRGILANADRNLLYVDEINLLTDEVVDAILDAAAMGSYAVRRGPVSATYRSRFALIGSMNPEEGRLRPQIMDRFGLRVIVRGMTDPNDRFEAYRRVQAYQTNPRYTVTQYAYETALARREIQSASDLLPEVQLDREIADLGLKLIDQMKIDSLRAEITLFEAARAYAAADSRKHVVPNDFQQVSPMALRLRRSAFMSEYLAQQETEDAEINAILSNISQPSHSREIEKNEPEKSVQKKSAKRR